MASAIPILRFDAASVPTDLQFEVFHDGARPFFTANRLDRERPFGAAAVDCLVGDLIVSRLSHDPVLFTRGSSHISRSGAPFSLQVQLDGEIVRVLRGAEHQSVPDGVVLQDMAVPFAAKATRGDVIAVVIPRDRLTPEAGLLIRPLIEVPISTPGGLMVRSKVLSLWADIPTLTPSEALERADDLVAAVNGMLESRRGSSTTRTGLGAEMRRYAVDHVDDLTLDADSLGAAFGVSRATVYRLFADVGGVAGFLRRLRIDLCFQQLTDPLVVPERIGAIADRWGFTNPSHFNRLVKRSFGAAPSSLASTIVDLTGRQSGIEHRLGALHGWFATTSGLPTAATGAVTS